VVTRVPLPAGLALTRWSFQGAFMVASAVLQRMETLRTVEHPRGIEEPAMLASTDGGVTREWGRQGCERRGARDGWYVGRWRSYTRMGQTRVRSGMARETACTSTSGKALACGVGRRRR
jgi:hypothetical protein